MKEFTANINIKVQLSFDEQQLLTDLRRAGSHPKAAYAAAHRLAYNAACKAAEVAAVKAFEDTYVVVYATKFVSGNVQAGQPADSQTNALGEDEGGAVNR